MADDNNVYPFAKPANDAERQAAEDSEAHRVSPEVLAALARRVERREVVRMIARHVPAAAFFYAAAYALPSLNLIPADASDILSWLLLGLSVAIYFRILYTGWFGPLLMALLGACAVYAMKEGHIAVDAVWYERARNVLTLCIATFIASVFFILFGKSDP